MKTRGRPRKKLKDRKKAVSLRINRVLWLIVLKCLKDHPSFSQIEFVEQALENQVRRTYIIGGLREKEKS